LNFKRIPWQEEQKTIFSGLKICKPRAVETCRIGEERRKLDSKYLPALSGFSSECRFATFLFLFSWAVCRVTKGKVAGGGDGRGVVG
jgi:hypothetical protein